CLRLAKRARGDLNDRHMVVHRHYGIDFALDRFHPRHQFAVRERCDAIQDLKWSPRPASAPVAAGVSLTARRITTTATTHQNIPKHRGYRTLGIATTPDYGRLHRGYRHPNQNKSSSGWAGAHTVL